MILNLGMQHDHDLAYGNFILPLSSMAVAFLVEDMTPHLLKYYAGFGDIMLQTACPVFNTIMVEGYAALFSCTAVIQASDSMIDVKLEIVG